MCIMYFFHQTGDFVDADFDHAFEFEAMACVANSKDMGPWQILAAANILQRIIFSVFTSCGASVFQKELHRPFLPKDENVQHHDIFILWTSTRPQQGVPSLWTQNHFVPLVKQKGADLVNSAFSVHSVPRVGDYVTIQLTVRRRIVTYHAVVVKPPADFSLKDHEVFVKFMKQSGRFFIFPRNPDFSVISTLETFVRICPPPTIKNRNRHFF